MPEDRFGDLGPPRPDPEGPSAAERFEEEDRLRPEPDHPSQKKPEVPRPGNKYAWVVGIVMLMGISVLLFTTAIPNRGEGLKGPPIGEVIPDFAAPAATGNVNEGVANVRQRSGGGEAAGKIPACEVRSEEVVNVCELRQKPLVITLIVTRGADCEPQVDRVERMRKDFPEVSFVAVVSGEERDEVERIARRRGWDMPVAVDEDGAITNLYGVGVCPTTVFAEAGGKARSTELGNLTEAQLRARVRRLTGAS